MGKALTDGEYKELLECVLEGVPNRETLDSDAIRSHLRAKTISHEALRIMLSMEPRQAVGLLAAASEAKSLAVTAPVDLMAILESQVDRLMDIDAFGEAKISKSKYRDELMAAVKAFIWRPELAAIGLTELALVDYRLSGKFLVEAGSVDCYIASDCENFKGIVTPNGVLVIQAQWGEKYHHKAPRWCRDNFHQFEQGAVVKEGLTAFLYGGEKLLKKCYMDLPGSVSEGGRVPFLCWHVDGPRLDGRSGIYTSPRYGSCSRGK